MTSDFAAPASSSSVGRRSNLWLALILVLGAALRLREARLTPLWFDEIFTLWMTRSPFGTMLERLSDDIHPPLMSALLWMWRGVGGEHVLWLKTLPILIGLLTVLALYFAVRDWFGGRSALMAAALLALHGMHVYFSQELRSYSLLILSVLLVTWTAWRWVRWGRTRDGVFYVASAALALYTHYLAGLVLMLLALWGAFVLRDQPRRLMHWVLWNAGAALAFLPQAPTFLHQLGLSSDHWMKKPTLEDLENLSRKVAFGARYMVPIVALIVLLPLIRPRVRVAAALVWWMMLAPVVVAFVLTYKGLANLFVERYMYFVVPLFCALAAEGLLGTHYRRLAIAASVVIVLFAGRQAIIKKPYAEAVALDGAVRSFEQNLRPGDIVFCADSHSLFVVENRHPAVNTRLLMTWPRLPYYEGASFIGDSMRATPEALESAASEGRRWWGLRTRHGGISSARGAALMDSLARGGREQQDMVTVWAGQPGMMEAPGQRIAPRNAASLATSH